MVDGGLAAAAGIAVGEYQEAKAIGATVVGGSTLLLLSRGKQEIWP
jgi:hypothetical protein